MVGVMGLGTRGMVGGLGGSWGAWGSMEGSGRSGLVWEGGLPKATTFCKVKVQ